MEVHDINRQVHSHQGQMHYYLQTIDEPHQAAEKPGEDKGRAHARHQDCLDSNPCTRHGAIKFLLECLLTWGQLPRQLLVDHNRPSVELNVVGSGLGAGSFQPPPRWLVTLTVPLRHEVARVDVRSGVRSINFEQAFNLRALALCTELASAAGARRALAGVPRVHEVGASRIRQQLCPCRALLGACEAANGPPFVKAAAPFLVDAILVLEMYHQYVVD